MTDPWRQRIDVFDGAWARRCSVRPLVKRLASEMIHNHYLHKWPAVPRCCVGMFVDGVAMGVIVFAEAPRETSKRYGGYTWELARLWISDGLPFNAETWFLARAVRYVEQHHREVLALVSYADPGVGHSGCIYRAANWTADGMTDDERKTGRREYRNPESGKVYGRRSHVPVGVTPIRVERRAKYRYVLRLRRRRILDAAPLFTQATARSERQEDAPLFEGQEKP